MKSNVLLYFDNKDTKEVVQLLLESKYEVKTYEASSELNALEVLKKNPTITMFVCSNVASTDKIVADMQSRGAPVPALICTHDHPKNIRLHAGSKNVHYIPANGWVEHITTFSNKYLTKKQLLPFNDESEEYWDADFCRINVKTLPKIAPLNVDIYIKLSEKKLLKIFQAGDVFDQNDLDKYMLRKNVYFFYIRNSDVGELLNRLSSHIQKLIDKSESKIPITKSNAFKSAVAANELLQEIVSTIGPSAQVKSVIQENIKLTIQSLRQHPKIRDYLNIISSEKTKYIPEHSQMVGQIACLLASMMEWNSEATFHKLTLAAFIHDIVLRNPELAAIESLLELETYKRNFSELEIKDYKLHPIRSAELVQELSDVPQDIEMIVLQHHEKPDGSGFPRGLTHNQIAPLSAIFIIAHDLTHYTITHGNKFDLGIYIDSVREKYNYNNFRKVIKVLEDIEIKRKKK